MELTANRRPFIYFPLRHHFEQNFHVRHRLERYRAGRCMDYATAGPADIASEIGREVDYRPVATDGAALRRCSASCSSRKITWVRIGPAGIMSLWNTWAP